MFSAGCDSSALCKCSAIRKWTILVKWSSSSQMAPPASSTSFSLKLNSTKSSNTSVSTACAEKSNIVAWRASAAKVLLYDDKWSFHVSQVSLRSLVTSRATVYGGVVNDMRASASDFLHKKNLPPGDRSRGGTFTNKKLRAPAFTYRACAMSNKASRTSSRSSAAVLLTCAFGSWLCSHR